VDVFTQAPGERVGRVDVHAQHRAGNVKLLARQGPLLAVLVFGDQVIRDRQAELRAEAGRAADGEDRAAAFEKLAKLRQRVGRGDAAAPAAKLRGQTLLAWAGRAIAFGEWLVAAGVRAGTVAGRTAAG